MAIGVLYSLNSLLCGPPTVSYHSRRHLICASKQHRTTSAAAEASAFSNKEQASAIMTICPHLALPVTARSVTILRDPLTVHVVRVCRQFQQTSS